MKISFARDCSKAGTGACSLRGGICKLGMGASCGLVCCTPGCASTVPESARPEMAAAASQMRFMKVSPRIQFGRFWRDYNVLPQGGNGALKLLQGESHVRVAMGRRQ